METPEATPEWVAWVQQAEHDLAAARVSHASELWDVAITLAEQAAEKAAKAVWIAARGTLAPRIHAVGRLLAELGAPDPLVKAGTALARGYFTVRYPPVEGPPPFTVVNSGEAGTAIADAEGILKWSKEQLGDSQR